MLRFLVLSTLVACAFGSAVSPITLKLSEGRIVNGTNAKPEECLYQVALRFLGNFICGGSILNEKHILTAGHCCTSRPSYYTVEFGTTKLGSGERVKVENVTRHDKYNSATTDFDVCVIKLAAPIPASNTTNAIPLATKEPNANETAIVCGWGVLSEGGLLPTKLQIVTVTIISRATCKNAYNQFNDITTNMLCAGTDGKDSCQGDSGGALVVNSQQAGIVSWGKGCAQAVYPGVYTNVAELISWIDEKSQN